MKPKDLQLPFSWKERRVLIQDGVWSIPDYYDHRRQFTFSGWERPEFFGNDNPVCVEYCSGNGAWIADRAQANPQKNWVAIEKRFDRVRKIWSKMKNFQLKNLLVIWGEGERTTADFFPDGRIENAFINFPDPWPKQRHKKHRLIKPEFVKHLSRIVKAGGIITIVTDDPCYSSEITQLLQQEKALTPLFPKPYYTTCYENYGTSFFDQLWKEKGKTIRYHQYCVGHG
ncbi:MAG: tRNA (guanosine(46)-N7)-methyltransferase TrmB [Waddliaceae bacterium]